MLNGGSRARDTSTWSSHEQQRRRRDLCDASRHRRTLRNGSLGERYRALVSTRGSMWVSDWGGWVPKVCGKAVFAGQRVLLREPPLGEGGLVRQHRPAHDEQCGLAVHDSPRTRFHASRTLSETDLGGTRWRQHAVPMTSLRPEPRFDAARTTPNTELASQRKGRTNHASLHHRQHRRQALSQPHGRAKHVARGAKLHR